MPTKRHLSRDQKTRRDGKIDRARYENWGAGVPNHPTLPGSALVALQYRAAVLELENAVRKNIRIHDRVLELGCGTGRHTSSLARTSEFVVGLDYASSVLLALRTCGDWGKSVYPILADMACTPFPDQCFDAVLTTTTLSYVDPKQIQHEISRLLRDGGTLIVLDSLRHNPLYQLNRRISCIRGRRTISTVRRIPGFKLIRELSDEFQYSSVQYFGHSLMIFPILRLFFDDDISTRFCEALDRRLPDWMAFKFVLTAKGFQKT